MKKILFIALMSPLFSNASETLLGSCQEQVRSALQNETQLSEITFDKCQWYQGQVVCSGRAGDGTNETDFSVGVMPNCKISFLHVRDQE